MKRFGAIFFILCCLMFAAASADVLFDENFAAAVHLYDEGLVGMQSVTAAGQSAYVLYDNACIYCFDCDTNEYTLYAQAPVPGEVDIEIPFSKQSAEMQEALNKAAFFLVTDGEAVWGVNLLSGGIGTITQDGIAWNDIRLDTSLITAADQAWPDGLLSAFVEEQTLYLLYDMVSMKNGEFSPTLLSFDLSTGSCSAESCPGALLMCRYEAGSAVFLLLDDSGELRLAVRDMHSGSSADLALDVPVALTREMLADVWDVQSSVGGLAWDASNEALYLADTEGLWCSTAGEGFVRTETVLWSSVIPLGNAWTLTNGCYVFQNGSVYLWNSGNS